MDNIWCIIIPILAAIISAILGWLLRSLSCGCDDEKNEIEKLKAKNNKLEVDLKACLSKKPIVDTSQINSLKAQNTKLEADLKTQLAKKPIVDTSQIDSLKAQNTKLEADLKTQLAKEPIVDTYQIDSLKAQNIKLEADLKTLLAKEPIVDTSQINSLKAQNIKLEADLKTLLAKEPIVDTSQINSLKAQNIKLEADLSACLAKNAEKIVIPPANTPYTNLGAVADNTKTEPKLYFNPALAKTAIGKKIVADDLKIVEGIGPKIEQLFHENGIKTWHQLSIASVGECQAVLDTGGKRYEIHNPSTWPKQADLAFRGKWEELNTLQDRLDGGVDRG